MLSRLFQQVSSSITAPHWYIAYSGGLDSHVLLHALATLKKDHPDWPALTAIHINHQLQVDADAWEQHCCEQALALDVDYRSVKVNVASTHNIEAAARQARYDVFSTLLNEGACLFMAHHQQDQAETFFYRLFRGSGIRGLMAIAKERTISHGLIVRPLLNESKVQLEHYAQQQRLSVVNDPSNNNINFDRNYIRHQLLPIVQQRWPTYAQVITRTIAHLREADELLNEVAKADIALLATEKSLCVIHYIPALEWSSARRKNALRYWFQLHGITLTSEQLEAVWRDVVLAKIDAMPCFYLGDNQSLRRFAKKLYIVRNDQPIINQQVWNGIEACVIASYGTLRLSIPLPLIFTVRPKIGGEVIQPKGCLHHKTVKNLLQEHAVPPWLRAQIPLVYYGEQLIAVGDLVLSEEANALLQGAIIVRD